MVRKALLIVVALLLPALSQAQVKLLRHPTYSKGKVAFSYLGDIWVANEDGTQVQRLTDNKARDVYPRFSPDGAMIAFSSNRDGNDDVFVVSTKAQATPAHLPAPTIRCSDGPPTANASCPVPAAPRRVSGVATREVPVEGGIEQPVPTDWGCAGVIPPTARARLHAPSLGLDAQALPRRICGRPRVMDVAPLRQLGARRLSRQRPAHQ
jgi:tricorn protease